METKKNNKVDVNEILQIIFAILLMIAVVLSPMILIDPLKLIKREIVNMGYDANNLTVERISFWKRIYKASTTVSTEDGQKIEYWKIVDHDQPFNTFLFSYAVPYFELPEYCSQCDLCETLPRCSLSLNNG